MPAGRRSTTGCAGRFSSRAARRGAAPRATYGGRILEIGVGTGLSFDDYDASTEITGIDMSEPMIARARERLEQRPLPLRQGTRGDGRAQPDVIPTPASTASSANSSSRWSKIPSACCRNARACSSRAARSCWSIISTRRRGSPPRSSGCWRRRRARLGLRPEFPFQRLAAWAREPRRRRADRAAQGPTPVSTRWCGSAAPCGKTRRRKGCES